jgi:TIR domain-containing protein
VDEVSSPTGSSPGPDAPVRVFMSYRRADDRHFVGRLHDQLCSAFGDEAVFRDIDSIKVGTNFRNVILRTLNEVDAVVAVIGPQWNRAAQADGDDLDYVFLELAEALRQGKPVVPALVEDTAMPRAELLPEEIRPLTGIHAVSVRADPLFRHDCARLVEAVQELVAADRARIAGERLAAAEAVRQAEAAQRERERRAEELRAEEREARLRITELEEAAAQRELER